MIKADLLVTVVLAGLIVHLLSRMLFVNPEGQS